jgi:hypothetical protein
LGSCRSAIELRPRQRLGSAPPPGPPSQNSTHSTRLPGGRRRFESPHLDASALTRSLVIPEHARLERSDLGDAPHSALRHMTLRVPALDPVALLLPDESTSLSFDRKSSPIRPSPSASSALFAVRRRDHLVAHDVKQINAATSSRPQGASFHAGNGGALRV